MSLLSPKKAKRKKLSLKGVELPAPKKRDIAPIKKVEKPQVVKTPKKEKPKTKWEKLNRNTRSFWIAGGRGGEIGWLNHREALSKRIN